jgi:hypothetical protein
VTSTLLARLNAKIERLGPDECWPWRGAQSRGKGRETPYGVIREGRPSTGVFRVNRLMLLIEEMPSDLDPSELSALLRAVNRLHAHEEASHQCDMSLCCNPRHLKWEEHADNVTSAATRRAGAPWRTKRPAARRAA